MIDLNELYGCPYCANKSEFRKYLIKKADGTYNNKRGKCPLCEEGIKIKTLKADMTPYEWGEWIYLNIIVYNSPHFHFYDKWQHDIFFLNLSMYPRDVKNDSCPQIDLIDDNLLYRGLMPERRRTGGIKESEFFE